MDGGPTIIGACHLASEMLLATCAGKHTGRRNTYACFTESNQCKRKIDPASDQEYPQHI
jgi:hypothetical protein